jgi:NodT family efflux transporter outer membrane factor (OMF) lipoprotein
MLRPSDLSLGHLAGARPLKQRKALGASRRLSGSLAAIMLLGACSVGRDFTAPAPSPPPSETLAAAQKLGPSLPITARWWSVFSDPTLNEVEARSLAGNLDLAEASARIGRARAAMRIVGAMGLPQTGAGSSYMRERASPRGILALTGANGPSANAAGGTDPFGTTSLPTTTGGTGFNLFQAGFDASWEIDLWGKVRRLREASRADTDAAMLARTTSQVSLSAEVATTYFRLRRAEARLKILEDNRKTVVAGQRIATERQKAGAATRFDEATAATQVAEIDAQLPDAEREAAEARNALALLTGSDPHALDPLLQKRAGELPDDRSPAPSSLPSDLARSRPDIRGAEADLHAATARIGVAKADFYPSLSLDGSFGLQSLSLDDLPVWNARQFVLGPVLHLPIFAGGKLKGRVDLARADEQASAIRYHATVLRAWHEIDNAIEALRAADAQVVATQAGVEQSRIAAHVSERRYGSGAAGYVDVLVSERARLEREAAFVDARTQRAIALIALYKAVGGGWTPSGLNSAVGA